MTTGFSSDIGDDLGVIEIFRASGESVAFKDLWDQQQLELALRRKLNSLLTGYIFPQSPFFLLVFPFTLSLEPDSLPFPTDCLYADPDRKAYNLFDLYYGFGRTFFNPASRKVLSRFDAIKKATENYTIEATPTDRSSVLQQGGMFVFKSKQLLYARKDEGTGDHASLEEVFDICCNVHIA
ncbi:hypothetical protein QQ045_015062 [Rhodiola kirilowii]